MSLMSVSLIHTGVPLVTQSDPGSENFGIANCHTEIRHHLDPSLRDTLQHRWMRNKTNIKPEIVWSLFRRGWSPGFETILDEGRLNGLYDVNEPLERYVSLFYALIFVSNCPFVQVGLSLGHGSLAST